MSSAVHCYIADLFERQQRSDCSIAFYCSATRLSSSCQECQLSAPLGESGKPAEPSATHCLDTMPGNPVPAHLVVICGGSEYFRAQVDRWTQQGEQQQPGSSKPVLPVPLDRPEDLLDALAALRFMYTGKLDGVSGAAALLRVRRLAAYLQVEGCVEACDEALAAMVKVPTEGTTSGSIGGVSELFTARQLLPDPADEPDAVHALKHACREQLIGHCSSGRIEGAVPEGGPSLGNQLGWAFGDAPSVLSDPATCRQMESLSAAAMEALLGSETFTTDVEDTVLLMLARWLQANPLTPDTIRRRLCRLMRLSQLSSTYLHIVLPTLSWFPITSDEHRFLCHYVTVTDAHRARLSEAAAGEYDCCSSAWYSSDARPKVTYGTVRRYDWHVRQEELKAELVTGVEKVWVYGNVTNGAPRVVSHGFEWQPYLYAEKESTAAGVFLRCTLPVALRAESCRNSSIGSNPVVIVVNPGPVRLVVHKWQQEGAGGADSSSGDGGHGAGGSSGGSSRSAGRAEAWGMDYRDEYVEVGLGWGVGEALMLEGLDGRTAGRPEGDVRFDPLLGPWEAYLIDGKLSGVLEWVYDSGVGH